MRLVKIGNDIMKEPTDVRKFIKGQVWTDVFLGMGKLEVLDVIDNKVTIKSTWFDACKMDWDSQIIETNQSAFYITTHNTLLTMDKKDQDRLTKRIDDSINNYKKIYGDKNRCVNK